jgi:peroxiredoxin
VTTTTPAAIAPDFALVAPATGQTHRLADVADRSALVVVFTCNHCPYAQAWEERLLAIGRDYADRIAMLLINANDGDKYPADGPAAMAERVKSKDYSVPYLHDASQTVARAYGASRTPEAFVYDAARRLVYHGTVDDNYEEADRVGTAYLRDAIEAVLANRPVPQSETKVLGCTIKWRA